MSKKNIKNIGLIVSAILFGILFIPVLVNQIKEPEMREFNGKRLVELNYTEVEFKNEAHNLSLAGLIFAPPDDGPHPSVVVIHGSGTSQRDNIWYLTLADYLQRNGILVFLPDKRGSEKSEGNWRTASFDDLASDAIAAISYLRSQNKFDITDIGVLGMSQGGQIAPIVGSQYSDVAFIVNVVGGALSMRDQFMFEETNNLIEIGFLPFIANFLAKFTTYYHINFGRNKAFWESVGLHDPINYWEKIDVRTLVMYGENDTNTPTYRSVERLRALNNGNIDIKIYKESGHALEDPSDKGTSIFREDALIEIKEFILSQELDHKK